MSDPWRRDRNVRSVRLLGGRYELGEAIGHGGMADVHQGFDTRLSRPVAIKLLRPDLVRDTNFLARFRREAQSAASLSHPSIVAIFDSGEEEGVDAFGSPTTVAYIVMELVEGQTLRERLSAGPLPPSEAARITENVLAALAYSHRMGIVHRDIKPANVMLTADDEVKVMDFGIARAVADTAATMTQTQAVLGTAQYLSPEQAQGMPSDARSDLYSTGCLLFELLTGRPPFVGDTPVAIAYQHVGEPPPRPSTLVPGIPEAYDAVVLQALVKDRDTRYQTAASFRADLAAAREGRAVSPATQAERAGNGLSPATQVITTPGSTRPGTTVLPPVAAKPREKPDPGRRRTLVLGALGAAVLVLLLALAVRPLLDGRPSADRVAVPALVGQTEEQARATLESAGLAADVRAVTNPGQPKGTVLEQDPAFDTLLDRGSTVRLTVSSGPREAALPSLVGQPQDAAVATLAAAGFANITVVLVDDPAQPKGNVVSTDPGGGQVLPLSAGVTLNVASGNVKVPGVVGLDTSAAALRVAELRLRYDDTQRVESTTVPEGKVISQEVAPETVVEAGTLVRVRIAVRPPVTVTATQTRTVTAAPQAPPAPRAPAVTSRAPAQTPRVTTTAPATVTATSPPTTAP